MCVNKHISLGIYPILAARRRALGLSQQELGLLAGLRREKINRVESRREDISLSDLGRLLDAVGLKLIVAAKDSDEPLAGALPVESLPSSNNHKLKPKRLSKAAIADGAKAVIVSWGKVPG